MIGISRKLQPVRLVRSRAKPLNSTPFNVNAYFKLKNSPVYNIKSFGDIKYSIRLLHDEKTTKQTEEEQVKVVLEDNEKNHTTEKIEKDTIEETPLIGKDLDIVHDYFVPAPVRFASAAVLLPFLGLSIAPFFLPMQMAGQAVFLQMTLGSSLLSFMGAPHWGLAMAGYKRNDTISLEEEETVVLPTHTEQTLRYVGGLSAPIISWTLMCLPPVEAMVGLMAAFTAMHIIEIVAHNRELTPSWYIRVKRFFSLGVVISLGINLIHML